ncbi:undecaprenyl-diphosphate phosphatase [Pelosinus propionicus]|uniref:Undecaprenyl-diphosphatase n=1 Tax=Pelosinus propionicus DSM 13327 TaxID=1123291 RepID=A0A1I4K7J4_9FIRM|nr:undecaprenyl-diphosphate phosphatase [Pelosinus propionicus]SFL74700.1 undecaprenyl-diphosphatase [Pelosinus propionicus DSM 13327]
MLWYIAIILGIVQGIGEFLPISSSAHLILTRWFFDWDPIINQLGGNIDIVLDVALHVGTLLSVLIYFYQDWLQLLRNGLSTGIKTREGKMFWYLVAATIPGGIAGLALESTIENFVRSQVLIIAVGLAIMGIILYYVDKKAEQIVSFEEITFRQAILIGIAQALALFPGVSRSGITMTTGRLLGFSREAAAKFSFLLATPIIAGAALKQTPGIIHNIANPLFLVGTLTSAVVGLISIGFLLKYLQRNNFAVFAIYRLAIAALVVIVYMVRGA